MWQTIACEHSCLTQLDVISHQWLPSGAEGLRGSTINILVDFRETQQAGRTHVSMETGSAVSRGLLWCKRLGGGRGKIWFWSLGLDEGSPGHFSSTSTARKSHQTVEVFGLCGCVGRRYPLRTCRTSQSCWNWTGNQRIWCGVRITDWGQGGHEHGGEARIWSRGGD